MKRALAWMAGNHVAANLLMLVFVVGGLLVGPTVKQEIFPEVVLDRIQVSVDYPGAGPEEVEEGIVLQIEDRISGIDGIEAIDSQAAEGRGTVTALVKKGADVDEVLADIKSEVDRITTFPEEAERPVITKLTNRNEVISLVVYGDAPALALRQQAEAIRDDLLALDGITQVELGGVRPYEISIEVDEATLRRYGLTLEEIARRIRAAAVDLPAGSVKAAGGEVLLRTKGKRYTGRAYGDLPIITRPDGSIVRLRDIATIQDGFADTDTVSFFDGKPAAMVVVFRVGDEKPIDIARMVRAYKERKEGDLPASLRLAVWHDVSELFASRMHLLQKNALFGLVLVFVTLTLFLQTRLALWVMLGIPISFFGTLLFLPVAGVSINMISLFAFIMALGILVDDAIVVGENIFEHRQRGKPFLQAAIDGVREVAGPVVFSILTSVAAFVPLAAVSGSMGKFIRVIPLVVITLLLVSLVESLFVLPAHLGHGRPPRSSHPTPAARVRAGFVKALTRFVDGPYSRFLDRALAYRYVTLAAAVALLFAAVGLVRGGIVKFRFMPEVDGDRIVCALEMERGTPAAETEAIARRIAHLGAATVADYERQQEIGHRTLRHVYTVAGGTMPLGGPVGKAGREAAHLANVALLLQGSEERGYPAAEITRRWRQRVGEIPGAKSLTFNSNLMRLGANIDVQLAHDDFGVLTAAAGRLKAALAAYQGVGEIADSYPQGKRELKISLTDRGRALGFTEAGLGRQLRDAFYGAEALRLQRGRNEVKVMVRYPAADRDRLATIDGLHVRAPSGGFVPLAEVATLHQGRGYSEINRHNLKRVVEITATVDDKQANAEEILADLRRTVLSALVADYPGLTWSMGGEAKERRDSLASMGRGFALALFAIYALLAIPFRSYLQPFLVMAAIPFGIVGAIAGHLIMGFDLSILSIFGIVALSGVVVNDSLLLIDQANRNRAAGQPPAAAVHNAGRRRFRPILLTSLTTFFGLMPMIFETSVQAQFLIPMAISLGWGILLATGITLALIPALYLVLEDLKGLAGHGRQRS